MHEKLIPFFGLKAFPWGRIEVFAVLRRRRIAAFKSLQAWALLIFLWPLTTFASLCLAAKCNEGVQSTKLKSIFSHLPISILREQANQRNLEYANKLILLPLIIAAGLILNMQMQVQRRWLKSILPNSYPKHFSLLELNNIFITVLHIRSESQALHPRKTKLHAKLSFQYCLQSDRIYAYLHSADL